MISVRVLLCPAPALGVEAGAYLASLGSHHLSLSLAITTCHAQCHSHYSTNIIIRVIQLTLGPLIPIYGYFMGF